MLPDLFRKLKPLYGKKIDALWIEYQTTNDVERKKEIEGLVTYLAVKRLGLAVGDEKLVLDAPPPYLIGDGEFTIGNVSYPSITPYPFRVARNELLRHVFILGPTGSGKSTLLLNLLVQLLDARVPVMVFDFKRNYRCLLAAQNSDLVVFTVGRNTAPLFINALRPPPGVEFEEWSDALSDIISTAYLLLQGARNVLKEALQRARREKKEHATLADAFMLLSLELDATRSGSRRYGWLESATRSVEELTKGQFGEALNATDGVTVQDLLRYPVVFELHGFGEDQKRFFCLFFLQAILLLRKNATMPREQLQHLLVFDEAHNIFPRERQGEVSVPARLAREVREYGEAIIAATQQADVSESLIANSGFKLILRCDYPRDVQFASLLLQIEPKWLPKLALGTGIARLPVRFYGVFTFTFPPQSIKNTVVPDAAVHEAWAKHALRVERNAPQPNAEVSEREDQLLRDVNQYPISTITERYARLGWHPQVGNRIKDGVIEKQLAAFRVVNTRTGRVKLLTLIQAGLTYLEGRGVDVTRARHGGPEHEWWKRILREELQRLGYVVSEEYALGGGKSADLRAMRDQQEVFVEIETGRSDIDANISKYDQRAGTLVIFCTDEQLLSTAPLVRLEREAIVLTPKALGLLEGALRTR